MGGKSLRTFAQIIPSLNPEWVGMEMARLPPDPKDAKTASKPEKEKRKKSEETKSQ